MEPVSYSKITDEAATLQGRVQSAPPEGTVTSSKIVNSKNMSELYHVFGIACTVHIFVLLTYGTVLSCTDRRTN